MQNVGETLPYPSCISASRAVNLQVISAAGVRFFLPALTWAGEVVPLGAGVISLPGAIGSNPRRKSRVLVVD